MASARAASVFHTSWRWVRPELGVGILQVSIIDTCLLQRTRLLQFCIETGTLALGTVIRRVPDVSSLNSAAPPRRRHPFRSDHSRNGQTGAPDEERHPRVTRYLPRSVLNKTRPSAAAQIGASLGVRSLGSQDGVPVACLKTSIAVAHPGGAVLAFNTPVGWLLDRGPGDLLYGGLPWWDRVWSDFVLRPRQRAGRRARPARTRSGPSGCPHHGGPWVHRDVGGAAQPGVPPEWPEAGRSRHATSTLGTRLTAAFYDVLAMRSDPTKWFAYTPWQTEPVQAPGRAGVIHRERFDYSSKICASPYLSC